jgi:hypothetical protein
MRPIRSADHAIGCHLRFDPFTLPHPVLLLVNYSLLQRLAHIRILILFRSNFLVRLAARLLNVCWSISGDYEGVNPEAEDCQDVCEFHILIKKPMLLE